jgi:hypothetical protein
MSAEDVIAVLESRAHRQGDAAPAWTITRHPGGFYRVDAYTSSGYDGPDAAYAAAVELRDAISEAAGEPAGRYQRIAANQETEDDTWWGRVEIGFGSPVF